MHDPLMLFFAGLAALAAGFTNAVAGGGTLISFPVLVACGLSPVAANVTNTVALCPGYFGGTLAQRKRLGAQPRRLRVLVPAALAGGLGGALLLVVLPGALFNLLVPWLILGACGLLGFQDLIRKTWLRGRVPEKQGDGFPAPGAALLAGGAVGLAAVYGGYFGAGLSVIVLAVLGILIHDELGQLNALKQAVSLAVNLAAAVYFSVSGLTDWPTAAVMAVAALAGGVGGGKLADRIPALWLRTIVVGSGLVVAAVWVLKG